MSRPTKSESIYQVSIHRNGGYMYASTHPYTTDEKTGKRKYVNLHWGTVDEGNSRRKFFIRKLSKCNSDVAWILVFTLMRPFMLLLDTIC